MPAVVVSDHLLGQMVEVKVSKDPFTSYVDHRQLEKVNNKTRKGRSKEDMPSAKELRKAAKAAGIRGWEDMDREELEEALANVEDEDEAPAPKPKKGAKPAKKAAKASKASKATKKAAPAKAKKAAASDDEDEDDGPNPFRAGSNLHLMTELLMEGGKRSAMVKKLVKKVDLNPRTKRKDFDPAEEIDYRLVRVCQTLTNEHGFTIEKDGRGKDQVVRAVPPS
jgi:hypothetical protein